MPSAFSHAIAAVAIGGVAVDGRSRAAIWGLGALCAVAPDLDVVSLLFGIPYRHVLGHRGLSHSLLVAAVLATLVTAVARRNLAESPGTAKLWPDPGLADLDPRLPRLPRATGDVERARLDLAAGGAGL